MIVKMIQNLRNRTEAQIEQIQEMFKKDVEELKNKHTADEGAGSKHTGLNK